MDKTLQKISPDQSTEFNGMEVSFGVAPILATISNMFRMTKKPPLDIFIVNVETLIRDRMKTVTKDTVLDMIAFKVMSDIRVIIHYVSTYNKLSDDSKNTPHIFVYFPNYKKGIPAQYMKEKLPKYTEERWKVMDIVVKRILKEGVPGVFEKTLVKWCMAGNDRMWPHQELMRDIKASINPSFCNGILVSHAPVDFHISKEFRSFNIIESYTGRMKSLKEFGKKVFGDDNIPFNKYTHLLLGDKWFIKSQLKNQSDKARIKEKAESKKWNMCPDRLILKDLMDMRLSDLNKITTPKI